MDKSELREKSDDFSRVKTEIEKVIIGQRRMIESMLIALLVNGHLLLEGLPGLAKTLAVNTLAKTIHCAFARVQFTPDLLPADLIGGAIYNPKEGAFSIRKGPIFTNILLADEINRAPAKVQSALLEVMQERQITIAGQTFKIDEPYMVLATQNPVEHEGTYPLPEAQTDRFLMKVKIDYPKREEEKEILQMMTSLKKPKEPEAVLDKETLFHARNAVDQIHIDSKIVEYLLNIIFATRYPETFNIPIEGLLQFGASPRASIHMTLAAKAKAFLEGRSYVTPDDIRHVGPAVLRHRLRRSYEAEAEDITPDEIIETIFSHLHVP